MSDPRPRPEPAPPGGSRDPEHHHCITCSDEGIPMRVAEPAIDGLAECVDDDGNRRRVETLLVGSVAPGDRLLVHADVALTRLSDSPPPESNAGVSE